jgi:hypothetical protein
MALDQRELIIAFTSVQFCAQPEIYPIWQAFNRAVLKESFGDEAIEMPSREELVAAAATLMRAIFELLTPGERDSVFTEAAKIVNRRRQTR